MTMSFPCNECQTPTTQSSDPDRWLCEKCGRTPPPAEGKSAFAVEPQEEKLSADFVVDALRTMAADKRLNNDGVVAVFRRASELIEATEVRDGQTTTDYEPLGTRRRWTLKEAQKKHRQSLMESGIDPAGEMGLMLRTSFLAGWKIALARGD